MNKTLCFSACYIDGESYKHSVQRYVNWYNYYSQHFDFDFMLFYDGILLGETQKELKEKTDYNVPIIQLTPHLGRIGGPNFPGCIRSIIRGIEFGLTSNYQNIIHLESDTFLLQKGIKKLKMVLSNDNYDYVYAGDSIQRHFTETTIQVYKDLEIAKKVVNHFKNNYESDKQFEKRLENLITPIQLFKGQKIRKNYPFEEDSEYISQVLRSQYENLIKGEYDGS